MSDVSLRDITKTYDGGVIGVDDLSLEIHDGEFLILVGPSGCGKSTTLELVAGLMKPTEGDVIIGTDVVTNAPPQDRNLAMVFQDYALYPHKTVRGNLLFGMKYTTDIPESEQQEKVTTVAETLNISELLDQKPPQLSGGQQQRVALGRAIVRDPEVFLLDEPLSNLDAKLRTQMRAELQRLQSDLDVTMIYVTHDQTEAMTMGDRIAILNNGELQQVGTPEKVYNDPANEFVAQFIGSPSMNLFSGVVQNDRIRFANDSVHVPSVSDRPDESTIRFGIRPEDILIKKDSDQGDIAVTVDVVENLGSENILHLQYSGRQLVTRVDERIHPSAGDRVSVVFREPLIYLFDDDGTTIKGRTIEAIDEIETQTGM